jgi:flagellum-specific ATP synthase
MNLGLEQLKEHMRESAKVRQVGRVIKVVGTIIEAELPGVAVGAIADIGDTQVEVVGFRESRALLMPLGDLEGISHGDQVRVRGTSLAIPVGPGLLGRVIDPLGIPLDGAPLRDCANRRSLHAEPPRAMSRTRITQAMPTGIRAIDGLLTLGEGQRIAIMAGSGVGKSTLLGMAARSSQAEVNVVCLVGERGREVREFLETDLGPEGLARSVVIVATSDRAPVLLVKAVQAALSVAEYFRDNGAKVMLMVDSLTRLAMAQRQIGLAAGEPPATRGYTPSVFTLLPRLLERAGPGVGRGSITAITTVLVEGDDMDDPVADTVRGIVDGHIVLSRRIASHGHYPAIDVLESVSRTMNMTSSSEHQAAARGMRDLVATWRENEELIRLGAYRRGTDAMVDRSIMLKDQIDGFLHQGVDEITAFQDTVEALVRVVNTPDPTRRPQTPSR